LNTAASRRRFPRHRWEQESAADEPREVGELELSRIVYGMWRLGDDEDTSPAHVQAKVEACLAQGITTMDQADIYGDYGAEALLGAAFRAAPGACATRWSWSRNAISWHRSASIPARG
jgi:predicted oxidoreductase